MLRARYSLHLEATLMTYLGGHLYAQLNNINYKPLTTKIKEDFARWDLIPYLSMYSRVEVEG